MRCKVCKKCKESKMEKKRLQGARFMLLDEGRNEVKSVMTDETGEALIEKLPFGKYYLVETNPPFGYRRLDKEIEILIDESCADRCVEVMSSQCFGSLKIIKCST